MANQQLIRGARMAADQFTDVSGAVERAVLRGEQALLRRRAEEQRLQENNARAIAQLPQLDQSKIPTQLRGWATGEAVKLREEAIAAINNPDFGPVEKQMAISNAIGKINGIATKAGDFKQWIANYADIQKDDFSELNTSDLTARMNDIFEGNFKVVDGNFEFTDGTIKDFNEVVNTNFITRSDDVYLNQLQSLGPAFDELGVKGRGKETFEAVLQDEMNKVDKYSDIELASVAIDNLGQKDLLNDILPALKEDMQDGKIDDPDNLGIRKKIIAAIENQFRFAAEERYKAAAKDRKALLDAKAPKDKPPKVDETVVLGGQEAIKFINDPVSYFRSVSSDKVAYDEYDKIFTLTTYDKEGKEIPISYDLTNVSDITRLFNEIQANKSYSPAQRVKIEQGLRTLLESPQFKQYMGSIQTQLSQREQQAREETQGVLDKLQGKVNTGNLPIETQE